MEVASVEIQICCVTLLQSVFLVELMELYLKKLQQKQKGSVLYNKDVLFELFTVIIALISQQ